MKDLVMYCDNVERVASVNFGEVPPRANIATVINPNTPNILEWLVTVYTLDSVLEALRAPYTVPLVQRPPDYGSGGDGGA